MIYNHMQEDPEQDKTGFKRTLMIASCLLLLVIILQLIY